MKPFLLEASCRRCGETFIPNDETDLIHLAKVNGTECGGKAQKIIGYYQGRRVSRYVKYLHNPEVHG